MFLCKQIPSRLIVSLLGCASCFLLYSIRISLSVAIIAMVNQTSFNHDEFNQSDSDVCPSKITRENVNQYQVCNSLEA